MEGRAHTVMSMLRTVRERATYSNLVSTLALFLVLTGGVAWAIERNAIKSKHIKDGAVQASDIQDGAIGPAKVADGAIGHAKIAERAVGAAKIDDGAIGAAKIVDDAVGPGAIADEAVGTGEIADGAIGASDVADDALTAADIDESTLPAGGGVFAGTARSLVDGPGQTFFPTGRHDPPDAGSDVFAVAPVDLEVSELHAIADPQAGGSMVVSVVKANANGTGVEFVLTCTITHPEGDCDSGGMSATIEAGQIFTVAIDPNIAVPAANASVIHSFLAAPH